MIQRTRLIELALAAVMFLVAALIYVVPDNQVGIAILGLAAVQFVRVQRHNGWAIEDLGVGVWLSILGVMTYISPVWGIPLLLITAGIQLIRALDEVGIIIDFALVAWVAYSRGTPDWAVAVLVVVAVGKLVFLVRNYARSRRTDGATPT
jgi:uncharacterized membrane protein